MSATINVKCTEAEAEAYTPHLKRVLKSYQAASISSLNGPNSVLWTSSEQEKDELLSPGPRPIQQPPLLLAKDRKCSAERSTAVLEGETISCFNVGGEDRLCLPQILNTVLSNFSLGQINSVCDDLQIYCSRCTDDQLDQLKAAAILPYGVASCGLITKTDAERLCASLLHQAFVRDVPPKCTPVSVYHECFGGCEGLLYADLYTSPSSACVRCSDCQGMLSPRRFISHVHRSRAETRTCHWGFSSANWRQYLLRHDEDDSAAKATLEQLKLKYDKRKKVASRTSECKSPSEGAISAPSTPPIRDDSPTPKKTRPDSNCSSPPAGALSAPPAAPHPAFVPPAAPAHHHPFVALGFDPTVWYQWAAATARSSAFKPWQTGGIVGPLGALLTSQKLPQPLRSQKRMSNGHSNSLDSTEDALSSASSCLSGPDDEQPPDQLPPLMDLGGLKRVLDHHNLNSKVRKDILLEANKIVHGYQTVVEMLNKQKRRLEKEMDAQNLIKMGKHLQPVSPCDESMRISSVTEEEAISLSTKAEVFVKQEPVDVEDENIEASAVPKIDALTIRDIRDTRSLLVA